MLGLALCVGFGLAPQVAMAQSFEGGASELELNGNATVDEKRAYAEAAVGEIGEGVVLAERLMSDAQRSADAESIACVAARLTSLRALHTVSGGAHASMLAALDKVETARADHEFRKIAVALGKARMLIAEAQRCTSDQMVAAGELGTDAVVDDLPGLDAKNPGEVDETDIGFDAPQASPFI